MQYTHADRVFDGDVPARRCGSFKIVFYEWLHTNTRYTRRADECKGFGLEMEDAGMSEGGGGGWDDATLLINKKNGTET